MKPLELQENLKKYTRIEECPIRNVISRFSGKWQMLVLCVLAENDATRFNAIGKAIPDISPKVLTDTLKNLERDNLGAVIFMLRFPRVWSIPLQSWGRA